MNRGPLSGPRALLGAVARVPPLCGPAVPPDRMELSELTGPSRPQPGRELQAAPGLPLALRPIQASA